MTLGGLAIVARNSSKVILFQTSVSRIQAKHSEMVNGPKDPICLTLTYTLAKWRPTSEMNYAEGSKKTHNRASRHAESPRRCQNSGDWRRDGSNVSASGNDNLTT